MTDLRKAAEMALEFVSWFASHDHSVRPKHKAPEIAEALRQALAQEWVCCVCGDLKALGIVHSADAPCFHYTKRDCDNCESLRRAAWDRINELEDRIDEYILKEEQQEPVAWMGIDSWGVVNKFRTNQFGGAIPLYKTPPKREWVGLDGEIPGLGLVTEEFYNGMLFAEDILKEKNT